MKFPLVKYHAFSKTLLGLYIILLFATGGYANANILRTVAAMKKVKVSNHIFNKRAF